MTSERTSNPDYFIKWAPNYTFGEKTASFHTVSYEGIANSYLETSYYYYQKQGSVCATACITMYVLIKQEKMIILFILLY